MDCCNYMQYRSHQPYGFGPGYYDHLPEYNHSGGGDFYGQPLYHDYYNSQYYPQQWSPVTPFPDYVYNPKEARIRKAMREATRDRSIGASPMLPRPGVRHASHGDWTQPQEEPLMMSPMDGMRRMDTPICNYPLSTTENGQYLQPMNGYSKIESPLLMPNYMQPSPLTQLQQQTELWHPYQDNMRPRSIGTPFHHTMISDMQSPSYHSQEPIQETATNLIMEKPRQSPARAALPLPETTQQACKENSLTPPMVINNPSSVHPESQHQQQSQSQQHFVDSKIPIEGMQATVMENRHQHDYMPVTDPLLGCNTFEPSHKVDQPVTVNKKAATQMDSSVLALGVLLSPVLDSPKIRYGILVNSTQSKKYTPESVIRVEVGRIRQNTTQSRTSPSTLNHSNPEGIHSTTFCTSPEFFSDKYHIEYITKYFSELPDYSMITVKTKEGLSFPYASLTLNGYDASNVFLEVSDVNSDPQLIPTDVGYVPVLEDDFSFDQLEFFQI